MIEYQTFIQNQLTEATDIALEYFGKVSGTVKTGDNNQVLTEADQAIGKRIVENIIRSFPDYNVIDEEAGVIDNGSNFTWVVDPIDGTSNFANGSPLYGCMVGLLDGATPIAGGVTLPAFQQLYVASKGGGSYCNGERMHVSDENALINCLVAYGIDGHQEAPELTQKETAMLGRLILSMRNLRSSNSVFDMMQAAKGVYGAYLNQTSKIWDNVAPQIIVEEAGGVYTDFLGEPIDYSWPLSKVEQNFTCCAASPTLHEQIQRIIHSD